jgi:arsenite-transporting ATPase
VTNPEKIVLKETQRAFMYFNLYKMNVDGIIVNRILPKDVKDTYFKNWRESQKKYMEQAEEYFSPIPTFHVNLFKEEILGYQSLKRLAAQIYGKRNPLKRFFKEKPYTLEKEDEAYRLTMKLPFIDKKDIQLNKVSDELVVRVGSFRRHVLLPRHVAAMEEVKAEYKDQHLLIHFTGEDHGKGKGKET